MISMVARWHEDSGNWWLIVNNQDTGISSLDPVALLKVGRKLESYILDQIQDKENNYGLTFYMAGYDGRRQQELKEYYQLEYNVWI